MVTLSAGGMVYQQPKPKPRGATVQEWDARVTKLLGLAVEYGRLDELLAKRRAWCAANWGHPQYDEREAATHLTMVERNAIGGKIADEAANVSRLHRELPEGLRNGLEALVGHPLWEYVPNRWAMTAARMQTTDIFAIAARVLMECRAEDEERSA